MTEHTASEPSHGQRVFHSLAWVALVALILIVVGVGIAVLAPRRTAAPAAGATSQPGAPLMIDAQIWLLKTGDGGAGPALGAAGVEDPRSTSRFWLDPDAGAALVSSLRSMGPTVATIQTSPRVVVASGQAATVTIGGSTTDGRGREVARDSREVTCLATLADDGLVQLDAEVWMRSADGRMPIMLQDLGLPIGEIRVRERIRALAPDEAAAIWIPDGDEGWLVLFRAAPLP